MIDNGDHTKKFYEEKNPAKIMGTFYSASLFGMLFIGGWIVLRFAINVDTVFQAVMYFLMLAMLLITTFFSVMKFKKYQLLTFEEERRKFSQSISVNFKEGKTVAEDSRHL